MIKIEIIFFLLINLIFGWNIQAQDSTNIETMENRHYYEVFEDLFKEVLAEAITGEIQVKDQDEIGKELEKRINSKFSREEIEKFKKNVPPNYRPKSKKRHEIFEELIEFLKDVFIPMTLDLQEQIKDKNTIEEKLKLSQIKTDYLLALDSIILKEKKEISKNPNLSDERKMDKLKAIELKSELNKIKPVLTEVWGKDHKNIKYLRELATQYVDEIEMNFEQQKGLRKQLIKIQIGNFGNFAGDIFSIVGEADERNLKISYVLDFLLMEF